MLTRLQLLSCFVCFILTVGFFNRRRKRIHIPLMVSALIIDLGMVVYLEVTRAVIESVPGRGVTPLLWFHIALSLFVLLLYGMQVWTGIRKARGITSERHRPMGYTLLVTRYGNLITSILVTSTG